MKTKVIKQLHGKTKEELQALIQSVKEELANFRLDQKQGKLKDTSSILHKRKEIARMQTVLQEKEYANENV